MKTRVKVRIMLLIALLAGCVGQQDSQFQPASPGGKLYISNSGNKSLLIYGDIINAFGPPLPTDCIMSGPTTTCNQTPDDLIQNLRAQDFIREPMAVFTDTTNNRLYVANSGLNQILIYFNASTITSNSVPDRVISGNATTMSFPRGLALDTTNNILYVATVGGNDILVFDVSDTAFGPPLPTDCMMSGPTTTCNFTPTRTITGLLRPTGLYLDTANDRLYTANTGQSAVLVFDNASSPTTVSPSRTITFSNTTNTLPGIPRLSDPTGLFVDTRPGIDRLYVANNGNDSILIFFNASTINGETIPNRAISGSQTELANPVGLAVDTIRSFLYVTSNASGSANLLAFDISATAFAASSPICVISGGTPVCNFTPSRAIFGSTTTLSSAGGIFYVDVPATPDTLYAANPGNNSIVVFNSASTATGNILPNRTISDAAPPLTSPGGVFGDVTQDLLYVAQPSSIVIFDHASTITSNLPPVVTTVSVPSLTVSPFAITVDTTQDRLYAATPTSVLVFDNASSLTGSPVPALTISGLTNPVSLFVDTTPKNHLYVAISTSVSVFDSVTGNPVPALTISGLSSPMGLFMDSSRDLLYVAESGTNSIRVYKQASASPTLLHTINGATTTLNSPSGVFVDPENDLLYVANSGTTGAGANSILVFSSASTADSDIAPTRVLARGTDPNDNTTLNLPLGIFVDTTR